MKFESLVDIEGAQLLKLNLKDHVRPKRDIFVSAATKRLLRKLKKARKKDVVEDFLDKVKNLTDCVWMNKNSSPNSMTKVYLSWRIKFDMVCEPL